MTFLIPHCISENWQQFQAWIFPILAKVYTEKQHFNLLSTCSPEAQNIYDFYGVKFKVYFLSVQRETFFTLYGPCNKRGVIYVCMRVCVFVYTRVRIKVYVCLYVFPGQEKKLLLLQNSVSSLINVKISLFF